MTSILAACSPGEIRVAVMAGGALRDYAIWRPGAPDGLGDVHAGRLAAKVPAMAGAFVEIGGGSGFLPDSEGAAEKTEGTLLSVRVTRSAQGGKGPRLAALPELPPPGPPRLLHRGPGALHRMARRYPDAGVAIDDPALFADLRPGFGERLLMVRRAFEESLEAEVEGLAEPRIVLPGGMRGTISPTPALTAIDLDGGAATGARGGKAASQIAANHAALPELARQIVLRNLSGAILIDFAGIPARRRASLAPALRAALEADPEHPRLLGFTQLGLAEILRPRSTPPLHELLAGPHAAGLAALRLLAADPPRRPVLRASPAIVAALEADPVALPDLARRLAHPHRLQPDPSLPALAWRIEDAA